MAWVEIEWTILAPEERAATVPPDTARVPYLGRARGMASGDPQVGEEAEIVTASGRRLRGRVVALGPGYAHSFGRPLRPWLQMRESIRASVRAAAVEG
jgi:hypothetical protein